MTNTTQTPRKPTATCARATARKDAHGMHKAARPLTEIAGAHPRHAKTPRARIALNGGHSPPEAAQGVEARRHEKGATRPRTPSPAHEGDGRHQKRRPEGKRDSTGHMGTMWSSPLCRNEASQVVGWQCKKSLPCCRRSSQPRLDLRLQARGGSAGVRPFRRARSARAIGRPRSHVDALVSLRSAALCKFSGGRPPGGLHN